MAATKIIVVFSKTVDIRQCMQPGTWKPVRYKGRDTAFVCCPHCHVVSVIEDHDIDVFGMIQPEVVCPSCSAEHWMALDTWRMPSEALQ